MRFASAESLIDVGDGGEDRRAVRSSWARSSSFAAFSPRCITVLVTVAV